jgi:predicted Zn-dependent protease
LGDVLSDEPSVQRLAILKSFAEKRPQDPFPRYALAMELKTAQDAEGAWKVLEALIAEHPDYVPSYAPAGEILLGLGRLDQARQLYAKGIEAADRRRDVHAREHLQALLGEAEADG